ncbi:hypothetical protein IFM89_031220 [Coptis chinensis]|uniref:DUF2828 domain-containing protein n=1 Tax=Coptis chinensis TaxID=261450 RepID=A0A835MAG5_9MAGN|nr:hypothetical protein IFM89_031220 [Coptis chinensis]
MILSTTWATSQSETLRVPHTYFECSSLRFTTLDTSLLGAQEIILIYNSMDRQQTFQSSSTTYPHTMTTTIHLLGPPELYYDDTVTPVINQVSFATPTQNQDTVNDPLPKRPQVWDRVKSAFKSTKTKCTKPPKKGFTENGSATFLATGNPCLDFFFHVVPDTLRKRVLQLLSSAWKHDPLTTLKLICQLRGVRGTGKSDKEGFYAAALWLHEYHPKTLALNVRWLAEFGYLKDLLEILYRILEGFGVRHYTKIKRKNNSVYWEKGKRKNRWHITLSRTRSKIALMMPRRNLKPRSSRIVNTRRTRVVNPYPRYPCTSSSCPVHPNNKPMLRDWILAKFEIVRIKKQEQKHIEPEEAEDEQEEEKHIEPEEAEEEQEEQKEIEHDAKESEENEQNEIDQKDQNDMELEEQKEIKHEVKETEQKEQNDMEQKDTKDMEREEQNEKKNSPRDWKKKKAITMANKALQRYNNDPNYRFLHDQISGLYAGHS